MRDDICHNIEAILYLVRSTALPQRDFTLCPASQRIDQNDSYFCGDWQRTANSTSREVTQQKLKLLHWVFNGTYWIAWVRFGAIDCISLVASRPLVTPSHRHFHPGKLTTTFYSPSKCSFSKASRKLFLLFQYFWLRQCCEKGEAERWIHRATEGEKEKKKNIWAHRSLVRTPGH